MAHRKLPSAMSAASRLVRRLRRFRTLAAQSAIVRRLEQAASGPFLRDQSSPVVVSLTSFPARIHLVWRAIESIFQQDTKPARVVLALSTEEFPNRLLPRSITSQCARGLEVLWTHENMGAYDKLLPAKQAFPEATIVTVDDDTFYEPSMLSGLIAASEAAPHAVIGHRGRVITGEPNRLTPYASWPLASPASTGNRVLLTGVGGILYPPHSLATAALMDYATAKRLCPLNDDLWFWACARLADTAALCLGNRCWQAFDDASETEPLYRRNVLDGMNDVQFKSVCDHFGLWGTLGNDPC